MATIDTSIVAPPNLPSTIPTAAPSPPSLDEMHLALSHIAFRRPPSPPRTPPLPCSSPDTKNLELSNLTSLLFVTASKGDVAAVIFRVLSKGRLELHYAKNQPCTNKEKAYIHRVFNIIARDDHRESYLLCWDILAQVILECKRKIKSRIQKICLRLEQLSPSFAICEGACTTDTEETLHQQLSQSTFPGGVTVPELLHDWFTHLLKEAIVDVGSVHQTLCLAYYIGHAPQMHQILDAQLLRRVRKLGDYYRAALVLIQNAALLPRDQLRKLRIIEAVPPTPELRLLRTNQVDMINEWARHIREPEVSEDDLRRAFPEMDDIPPNPTGMPTVCVHCECTLLLEMINLTSTAASASTPTPVLLEIGVSKSSCFMCREFVAAVQKVYRHITVRVSSGHGKHVAGWSLPESAPAVLRELMEKRVQDEMDNVLQRATRKRVSDSIPRANTPTPGEIGGIPSREQLDEQWRESGDPVFASTRKRAGYGASGEDKATVMEMYGPAVLFGNFDVKINAVLDRYIL
ncbi:hypothetical protein Q9L58_009361 [Maublancomyces gigas]|uniref:Uncharacterized protein n=1 Tax=Discina gigas TaxID=1032678 RepID=A0ABR3G7I4_9PEZI